MKILNFGEKNDNYTGVLESGMCLLSSSKLLSRPDIVRDYLGDRQGLHGGGEQAEPGSHTREAVAVKSGFCFG